MRAQLNSREVNGNAHKLLLVTDAWLAAGRSVPRTVKATGLGRDVVLRLLVAAREEWKRQAADLYATAVAEELAEINAAAGEAWQAWREWRDAPNEKIQGYKFLEIIEKCSQARRALVGLDKPVKVEMDVSHFIGDPDRRDKGWEPMTLELATVILSDHGLLQSRPGFDPCEMAKRLTSGPEEGP
jgi:hypothetical protein